MQEQLSRTALLLGEDAVRRLRRARVAIFGVGGVGGYAVEALARTGVGALDLIDNDRVSVSNLNRQLLATHSTVGRFKVEVARERILDINPECTVRTHQMFFLPENSDQLDFSQFDYVIDAIDTIAGKQEILLCAKRAGVPVISSMGAGNKLDPTAFRVADIFKTSMDPLARVMRGICRKNGIRHLKVVYSEEPPLHPAGRDEAVPSKRANGAHAEWQETAPTASEGASPVVCESATPAENAHGRRDTPGSVAFVPSVAGLILAGEVIRDLIRQ